MLSPATVDDLLREARRRLRNASFEASPREALLLLGRVLGRSEASLLARGEEPVEEADRQCFEAFLERRLTGEPVAYLFGERELFGRVFRVDRRVLVPRPETEHLIEAALALGLGPSPRVLDVGTGSGAIAVTLALEIPGARVVAADLSLAALAVTCQNVTLHGVERRVWPVAGDLTAALRLGDFDLVVSNPPYIDPAVAPRLSPEVVEHEPHLALFAAGEGRAVLTRLLDAALELRPGVALVVEIGHDQADWLRAEVALRRGLEVAEVVRDYGGIGRTAVLRRVG